MKEDNGMLDYKDIIIKSYALNMSGAEIARQLGCSKSGVNDFLNAFKKCETYITLNGLFGNFLDGYRTPTKIYSKFFCCHRLFFPKLIPNGF